MSKSLTKQSTAAFLLAWLFLGVLSIKAEAPFDYFQNSWALIGLKDYQHGTRITPNNELMLSERRLLQFRIGPNQIALDRHQVKTSLDGWLPVILIAADDGPVRYEFTFWAAPLPDVKNWRKAYGWPTEGENYLNWAWIKVTNTGKTPFEAKISATIDDRPDSTLPHFEWLLAGGQSEKTVFRVPFEPLGSDSLYADEDPKLWLKRTLTFWQDFLARGATIQVPCQKATDALKASHVLQLITSDHGELNGGEGFYDEFYIRDGAYQIMQLEEAGFWDEAEKAIDYYVRAQRDYGRFETQENQYDANGQALWALWQYYKITGYKGWLADVYPQMLRCTDWLRRACRREPPDSPFAGLLPSGPDDGEFLWDGKHHAVGYDFWNLRGLQCTIDAAKVLNQVQDAERLLAQADAYRGKIDSAWMRTGLPYFPPSWESEGTHWGNTETLWPTELFNSEDARVAALLENVRNHHGGGFVEGAIQWLGVPDAIHPYLSVYSTMASLSRGESEEVVKDFYWYLLHSTATHAFAEGIYYKRRFAWNNTIPHGTGASNYATLLRHMLVHERSSELHLLPAVPDWWLDKGKEIRIERAPTHFGVISLLIRGTSKGIEVDFDPPDREKPARILLHLPKSRPLRKPIDGVQVIVRPNQKKRWDFESVVKEYEKQAFPIDYVTQWKDLN